jgi:hypothetical protein
VSDFGRVKSLSYNTKKEKILKTGRKGSGYVKVVLHKKGKRQDFLLHRLVWSTFNGPIPKGLVVNHLNEIKDDNRLENLEVCTQKENINYGTCKARISEGCKAYWRRRKGA